MKLSGVFSTAALVAICAVTLPPTPVEAGSLQVMGKTVHGTHQFSRRAANNSPRRLDTVVANGSHARRTFEDEVLSQHRRRAGHKKRCKSKGGSKTPSSGGHNTSDRSEGGDDSSTSSSSFSKTASAHHSHPTVGSEGGSGHNHGGGNHTHSAGGCFPALGFKMPSDVPSSTDNWWCDPKDEVAFMGFSYSVTGCPGTDQMKKDFANMRSTYKSRYVRAYGGCDQSGFTDKMVNAAWEAGLGLYPLVWFGFDGGDQWKQRRDDIVNTVKKNPKAPFVIRGVVLGSEPLFDNVLPGSGMANELKNLKNQLKPYSGDGDTDMQVTLSEMPYAFSINQAAQSIFSAIGIIQGNVLPFFDQQASTGAAAKSNVQWNLDYFKKNGQGKKILFTQTGWPSNKSVWPGNNNQVQASVEQEKAYFDMLDDNACGFMKDAPKGGVGYFAHIYSDNDLPGWGVVKSDGSPKFKFSPKTSCD